MFCVFPKANIVYLIVKVVTHFQNWIGLCTAVMAGNDTI